jgi:Xaa-Pro aminopeptidase
MSSILTKISAAAILLAATAIVPACTNPDKAQLDKISKDVSDAKMAAESAARSAAQAADAAKAAQQAADQASMTQSHATGHGMRNK